MKVIDKVDTDTIVEMAQFKETINPDRFEHDREARVSAMLGYIRQHAGETITLEQLAQAAGYASPVTAGVAVRSLIRRHRLIREKLKAGKGHHYTYYLGNLEAQGKHNGPAVTTAPAETPAAPEVEKPKFPQPSYLDQLIWDFLKSRVSEADDYELGGAIRILQAFSDFTRQ